MLLASPQCLIPGKLRFHEPPMRTLLFLWFRIFRWKLTTRSPLDVSLCHPDLIKVFIRLASCWAALPRYNLVNTQKKPFISTVDYTSAPAWPSQARPSQAGLILLFPFSVLNTQHCWVFAPISSRDCKAQPRRKTSIACERRLCYQECSFACRGKKKKKRFLIEPSGRTPVPI